MQGLSSVLSIDQVSHGSSGERKESYCHTSAPFVSPSALSFLPSVLGSVLVWDGPWSFLPAQLGDFWERGKATLGGGALNGQQGLYPPLHVMLPSGWFPLAPVTAVSWVLSFLPWARWVLRWTGEPGALRLTAWPICCPCRRSFPSWLCPPRWPRASRSWTPTPA